MNQKYNERVDVSFLIMFIELRITSMYTLYGMN